MERISGMNTPYPVYSKFEFDDMTVLFLACQERLIFSVIPAGTEEMIPEHRKNLNDTVGYRNFRAVTGNNANVAHDESMIQLHLMQDPFAYSNTMRNGHSTNQQKLVSQTRTGDRIVTVFSDERGIETVQTLEHRPGEKFVSVFTEVTNKGSKDIELGMVESVSLGMLSPFHRDHAPDSLKIHRYRSNWSGEGRETIDTPDELALTNSWAGGTSFAALRYGQRSSMVTREWFPSAGLTDSEAGVAWAIQLATVQPWQICISRKGDFLNFSGGPADYDFADWRRTLKPGETFKTFPAVISCVRGSMDDAFERLTEYPLKRTEFPIPSNEKDMPVLFNEFVTTWGAPTEKNLLPVIEGAKGLGFRYFVIDGGWGRNDKTRLPGIGDWRPDPSIYPSGFEFLLDKIREAGMIPGIWFEFECASGTSALYREHPDWFVQFEGKEYKIAIDRHFLDLRKKEVIDYLDEHVIGFLKKYGFGYMKVDYNAKIHRADCGCGSGAAGAAELLEAIREYYAKIRRELPELVLEVCSSGGQRLSPGWMAMGSMASFSDCHEGVEIPLVAVDTARQIPFRMNQVWCALREGESQERTGYLLAGGFLGRMCLSGNADRYSDFQKESIRKAVRLYREASDVLENGHTVLERKLGSSAYFPPKGYQLFRRISEKGEVLVLHLFEDSPATLEIPVRFSGIAGTLTNGEKAEIKNGVLCLSGLKPMSGAVLLLR